MQTTCSSHSIANRVWNWCGKPKQKLEFAEHLLGGVKTKIVAKIHFSILTGI